MIRGRLKVRGFRSAYGQCMQMTLVWSSLHSWNPLHRIIPWKGLWEPPFCHTHTVRPSRRCLKVLLDTCTCPAPPPSCLHRAQRDGDGSKVRGADGKQKPRESSAPRGYFLSPPNEQGSQLPPRQGQADAVCGEAVLPIFAKGRAAGEHGWAHG